jgi:cell division ATPase FtsA
LDDELIAKELKLFEEEHKHFYEDGNGKATTIELKNMKTILNGYESANPYGQKAKEVEMSVFVSMVEEHIVDMIVENINRHFRSAKIKFISFVMASSTVARDMFVNQDSFLLVNIGGEVTDISMIKKDIIKESISFPMGRNFMVRGLAEELGVELTEAETYLSLYKDDHLDTAQEKKIEPAVTKIKTEWLKNFQDFLSTLSNDISIPSTVFITVEKDLAKFFSDIIKTEQFNQYILTESKFRVIFLGSQELHGIATLKDHVERDPFLVIESIYINHFLS